MLIPDVSSEVRVESWKILQSHLINGIWVNRQVVPWLADAENMRSCGTNPESRSLNTTAALLQLLHELNPRSDH